MQRSLTSCEQARLLYVLRSPALSGRRCAAGSMQATALLHSAKGMGSPQVLYQSAIFKHAEEPHCCTALQGRGSGLVKLAFSSDDILRAGYPRRLSDAHSLLFSCMALSGKELPWAEAAAAHDRQRVLELRCLALKEGASAPLLGGLSPLLRSFAGEHLSCLVAPAGAKQSRQQH